MKYYPTIWGYHFNQEVHCSPFRIFSKVNVFFWFVLHAFVHLLLFFFLAHLFCFDKPLTFAITRINMITRITMYLANFSKEPYPNLQTSGIWCDHPFLLHAFVHNPNYHVKRMVECKMFCTAFYI